MLEEQKVKLRARGMCGGADGVEGKTPAARYDEASKVPPRAPLSRERIDARNMAIKEAKANKTPPAPRRMTSCPFCDVGGHVVPFDGDGNGNVTVFRCLTCQTNWNVKP